VDVPRAPRKGQSTFTGVWCTSRTDCLTVGYYSGDITWHPFIESWHGTSWTIDPSPIVNGILNGISCFNAADCVAVGQTITSTTDLALVDTWNGKTWNLAATPRPGTTSILQGVSCVKKECYAVGLDQGEKSGGGLVETSIHRRWSQLDDPAASGEMLNAISCISSVHCVAVGGTGESQEPFAETWNGSTWTDTPTVSGKYNTDFASVSCASSKDCFAVGCYDTTANPERATLRTLIEQWNGTAWTLVNAQNAVTDAAFSSISCINPYQCAAVGTNDGKAYPLIELWDGNTWSAATAEAPPGNEGIFGLSSVSCIPNHASCTGVGTHGAGRPLVETGNLPAPSAVGAAH
jgi:hypothetical protein